MSLSELAKAANPIQAILELAMKEATFNSLFLLENGLKRFFHRTITVSRE
tara:strand:+ start:351 stop:500 length:150 start_codon:yes stop_codon:yes gene_type:complete